MINMLIIPIYVISHIAEWILSYLFFWQYKNLAKILSFIQNYFMGFTSGTWFIYQMEAFCENQKIYNVIFDHFSVGLS